MGFLLDGIMAVTWQKMIMYAIGIGLIWLAVKRSMSRPCCFRWDLARFL